MLLCLFREWVTCLSHKKQADQKVWHQKGLGWWEVHTVIEKGFKMADQAAIDAVMSQQRTPVTMWVVGVLCGVCVFGCASTCVGVWMCVHVPGF